MIILKWIGGVILFALAGLLVLLVFARFMDGPLGLIPGGPLVAGEWVEGPVQDWTFVRDIPLMEIQLVDPPRSRTTWLEVYDKKLYLVSGYMNSTIGKLWKDWPAQAVADGRAVVRIAGKRYPCKLVRIMGDRPTLEGIAAEINRKYGAPLTADMAATGDAWFFAVEPRE